MIGLYVFIGFLLILVAVLGFGVANLLKKLEILEDLTQLQKKTMQEIADFIGKSRNTVETVDEKGIFQADDDIGDFFKYLKEIQKSLDNFNKNLKNG